MTVRRATLTGAVLLALLLSACVPVVNTTTVLTASATRITQGQSVTLTARITTSPAGGTPSGSVRFRDGAKVLGTVTTSGGLARLTTASLAVGTRVVEARFTSAANAVWGASVRTITITVAPLRYHLALGDSLAAGVGAPAGLGYVPRITAAEKLRVPGLTLQNLSCGGASTGSMLVGPGCSYTQGNQVAAAEAFLLANPGAVSFITINIGGNDIRGCVTGSGTDPVCSAARIATIQTNLAQILSRLRAAAPGVPIIGMTYYNPFLAFWVAGNQAAATGSAAGAVAFNSALATTYTGHSALVAPVAAAFGSDNTALTGTWLGVTVPQNVANICAWTHMCTRADIHANTTGHQLMATTFVTVINTVVPAA